MFRRSLRAAKIRLMPTDDRTYRIDPIEPAQVGDRLRSLLDRLEPVLRAPDVAAMRGLIDAGDLGAAYAHLDSITNDGTVTVDTPTLIEIVLLGQAIRQG
jgi:hypothetical protein